MFKLGVNIDHVATLRQARWSADDVMAGRGGLSPEPVWAAKVCEKAGAHSIVMHLREDRRHIQDTDLFKVQKAVSLKINMEMSIASQIVKVALKLSPHQATLVPEKRMERTTEGGLDLFKKTSQLRRGIDALKKKKIAVSLFIDPDLKQLEEAKRLGADAVEFHTGDYANQAKTRGADREFHRLKLAVQSAAHMKLTAHAGHGLDYQNVVRLKSIKGIEELNIGFSIVGRALETGLEAAVKEMLELIS